MKAVTAILLINAFLLCACTPTVQLALANEPITINMNVRIDHEIRVKVDKEFDAVITRNEALF